MGTEVLAVAAVLGGAAMQRFTGMGFALVAAPFLVLLLGPVSGVVVVNLCGAVTAGIILLRVRRDVDWRKFALLVPAALAGIIPAAFAVRAVPGPVLEISIGLLLAAGLTVMVALRSAVLPARRRYLLTAGALSGFMNTTAGVGGPAVSIYSMATRWPQQSFAATMQPYFFTIGSLSLAAKAGTAPASLQGLHWSLWLGVAAACLVGLLLGEVLARRVPARAAQIVLVVLAYLGAVATVARGLAEAFGVA